MLNCCGNDEPCISCMLKLSLPCGTEFSRMFLPELYPWRLSFRLATWKWKGEGVDLSIFLCRWLVLRGHLYISFLEGDFAYGEGWPAEDVSVSCCITGVGWAPSTVVSQKGGLALIWIPNSVVAIGCKYVLGVRSRKECFLC